MSTTPIPTRQQPTAPVAMTGSNGPSVNKQSSLKSRPGGGLSSRTPATKRSSQQSVTSHSKSPLNIEGAHRKSKKPFTRSSSIRTSCTLNNNNNNCAKKLNLSQQYRTKLPLVTPLELQEILLSQSEDSNSDRSESSSSLTRVKRLGRGLGSNLVASDLGYEKFPDLSKTSVDDYRVKSDSSLTSSSASEASSESDDDDNYSDSESDLDSVNSPRLLAIFSSTKKSQDEQSALMDPKSSVTNINSINLDQGTTKATMRYRGIRDGSAYFDDNPLSLKPEYDEFQDAVDSNDIDRNIFNSKILSDDLLKESIIKTTTINRTKPAKFVGSIRNAVSKRLRRVDRKYERKFKRVSVMEVLKTVWLALYLLVKRLLGHRSTESVSTEIMQKILLRVLERKTELEQKRDCAKKKEMERVAKEKENDRKRRRLSLINSDDIDHDNTDSETECKRHWVTAREARYLFKKQLLYLAKYFCK